MKRILFLVLAILCLTSKAFCDQPRAVMYGLNALTPVPVAVDSSGAVILSNTQPTLVPTATATGTLTPTNTPTPINAVIIPSTNTPTPTGTLTPSATPTPMNVKNGMAVATVVWVVTPSVNGGYVTL